jgi:methylamine dehydrogenase heavy chain
MALHRASGHLFVLMHPGEYWTHKAGGTEIWDVDLAAKKVVKRVPITDPATTIEVTQEAAPKLMYSGGEGGTVHVVDLKTWDETLKLDRAGSGVITVVDAR